MKPLVYTEILKTNINILNMEQTVSYLEEHLEELRGEYICVSNVHTTVMAYRDPEYRKVQNGSAMNLPDGKPLSITQRRYGYSNAGRVPGPDLMLRIFRISEKYGYRHFFYGSTPETLKKLINNLKEKFPELQIAGSISPPFHPMTEEEDRLDIKEINDSKPDFIWVGLGAPKQEKWMAAHKGKVTGIMLGVGAGFDFHAGTVKRAPKWMQELCIEWLWRMLQDPIRLFPRYFDTNTAFLCYLRREKRKKRKEEREARLKYGKFKISMIGHKRIPSREGGVEIVVEELSTRMVKLGNQVDVYNRSGYHVSGREFDEKRGKIFEGTRLYTIPTFRSSKLNAIVYSFLATVLATARSAFRKNHVIHFHAEGPCMMLWIPKLFGIRTIATIHGLDWQRSKWSRFASGMLKLGERTAAKHADEVIVLSQNVKEYFQKEYHRETVYIPNGIDRPQLYEAREISQKYGLVKDEYILFLARIVPEKGIPYLLEAFSKIKTDKKLVIAGGCSHSQEYMEYIRELCSKDQRVIMTGFVQGDLLKELFSNAWLFVLPSDVEGMAISLLEAMSYGRCCLVSDIPENTEVVSDCAFTFQKSNAEDLREKLEYLLSHEEERLQMSRRSQDYICNRYHWDKVVERTLELYRDKREK